MTWIVESTPTEICQDILPVEILTLWCLKRTGTHINIFKGMEVWVTWHFMLVPQSGVNMLAFIGIILYMGMVKLPTWYTLYCGQTAGCWTWDWSKSSFRFLNIMTYSSIVQIMLQHHHETVRRTTGCTVQGYRGCWHNHRCLAEMLLPETRKTCDETIVPFSGISGLKGYNPQNPHMWHDQGKWVTCRKFQILFSYTIFS